MRWETYRQKPQALHPYAIDATTSNERRSIAVSPRPLCPLATRPVAAIFALCSTLAVPAVAAAQQASSGDISAQRFLPAPGPRNLLTVSTLRTDGELSPSVGALINYARQPLRLRHCEPQACDQPGSTLRKIDVVKDLVQADLLGALTIVPRVQVGLRLPVAYVKGEGVVTDQTSTSFGQPIAGGLSGAGLGDPELSAKVRAVGDAKSPVTVGGQLGITAPLGSATAPGKYIGDGSVGLGAGAIADARIGRVLVALNLGGFFREKATLGSLTLGPEARGGVGVGVDVTRQVQLMATAFGSSNFSSSAGTNASEANGAIRYTVESVPIELTAGGGAGINQGLGAPVLRAFLGALYFVDREPPKTEPQTDDRDADGIPDRDDQCPAEGGDVVRTQGRYLGCPRRDADGDSIPDNQDACPEQAGIKTEDPSTNGCPDPDRDHDGIPNDRDQCPDKPEVVNGVDDGDGCPDEVPIQVEIRKDEIVVINEHINFEFNSDKIAGPRSFQALDMVAEAMKKHPEIKRVEVAGHTDAVGAREENLSLSSRRAAAVLAYLTSRGIAGDRLVSKGYGPDKPVASNENEEGRARNRRVEFKILILSN